MYRLSSLILALWGFTQIYAQTSPHGKNLNIDCAKCHTSDSWDIDYKNLKFDHNVTDFKLEGVHLQTNCTDCHKTLVFDKTASDCMSCHTDIHSASVGNDCARCHTPKSWTVDNISELHNRNGFSLTGAHDNLSCIECHTSETNLRFDRIGNECINCHKDDFNKTTDPNHVTNNFSLECTLCHSQFETAWTPVSVKHDFFPLTQGHDIQNCLECHKNGQFNDTSSDCVSCHQTDFDNTTNPNHKDANFDTDCKSCHTTTPGWTPTTFDHSFFALTQGHDIQDCNACHSVTTNYADTPTDCVSCHQTDFNNTTDPNHISSGFPTDCVTCHTTNPGWTPATFDHSSFPLTEGHNIQDCNACHTTGNFSDASPDCVSCHQTNFNNTTNPNHTGAGFDTDCAKCHTPSGWTPSTFDHSFFPLTLGHDIQDCATCHTEPVYANQSPNCVSCHQTDFNNTTDPNHISSGFPTDCASCHTTNPGWTPATFDHTNFPLTLGHDIQDCNACHTTGNFSDASPDCVSCHQTDFNNTTNPNHVSGNFPTDCASCHTTNPGWTPATFDHTNFPLTLGHDIQDCNACHTTGNFSDASPDCVSCHQTDYNNTTNPNHLAAGFPTDCISCHTTNPGWTPSTFDHDGQYFPIYSGKHQGEWNTCSECHTVANNFTSFSCIDCHEHSNQAEVDNKHQGVSGYTYQSSACYECHPNGRED